MDLNKREDRYYVRIAGKIESELGLRYEGKTDRELKAFVNDHVNELDMNKHFTGRWKEKERKKTKPLRSRPVLKSAPVKPAGQFRKHGEEKFKNENT